jgi:hypothetical protein
MTPDESIARATWGLVIATGGLILVTFLLVADGIRKSREQNRRWKDEDERRAEEAKPSAIVELATPDYGSLDMLFAFFNLGNNTFFVDRMVITSEGGTRHESDLSPRIVTPGTYVTIGFEPSDLLGYFGEDVEFKEAQAIFVLKGATGEVTTEPVWFYVSYRRGGTGCAWGVGRLADRESGVITKMPKVLGNTSPPAESGQ